MNYVVHKQTLRVLLFIAALTATAFACGWIGTSHSVRFNQYQTEREMRRLPPLPTLASGNNRLRIDRELEYWNPDLDYGSSQERSKEVDALWDRAEGYEQEGKLSLERDLLREYLERTRIDRHLWFNPADRQQRRNFAFDKLDALEALDRGSSTSRVQQYLAARRLHDEDKPVEEVDLVLRKIETDVNLKDNVAYLRAARIYQSEQFEEAARAFAAIARGYPHSEKREASLFMAAIALMKTSSTYTPTSGDEAHLHEDEPEKAHDVVVDGPWRDAIAGFKRLMAEYPRGRFLNDARGWAAYLMLRNNDRAGALVEYYRLLGDKHDENARIEAAFSLTLVRHHATEEEMSRVEKELERQPDAALAYAYHNIYNYSIDPGPVDPPYEPVLDSTGKVDYGTTDLRYEERQKEWSKKREVTEGKVLERVLAFSRRLMERYPNLAIGGSFALRAAQASMELENNETAAQFAQRALKSRLSDEERAQALWTFGVAEHRLKHFDAARKSFNTLVQAYPKSHLIEGARRMLAMIAEDAGDIEGALEQYVELEYSIDMAYFVDTLMTIEQLASFIQRHPHSPKKNEFTYALGLRYLRANRWAEARTTFANVRTVAAFGGYSNEVDCPRESTSDNCVDPKRTAYDEYDENPIITHRMVMRDVQTANDLEALEKAVSQGLVNEAKAEALYQFANYQYESTSLLFYNPVAWTGQRYLNLSHLANWGQYRTTNESQILFAYMQEHDTLARALKVYLEVFDKYPRTRAAQDALYTAAVCHERLANYNAYWREIYAAGLHAGSRMVTYADVKAAYPTYQLPRGTYGWEPSTRTVLGGPGWAPPPKFIPPPTRMARLTLLLESVINPIQLFWNEKGRRWLTLITILIATLFTLRIAKQNRRRLRPKIARLRISAGPQVVDSPATGMFWLHSVESRSSEQMKQFMKLRGIEFWELARDAKSRPILVRNVLSHTFLAGLIVSLFWTLHFG